jgi:hypothetical protein
MRFHLICLAVVIFTGCSTAPVALPTAPLPLPIISFEVETNGAKGSDLVTVQTMPSIEEGVFDFNNGLSGLLLELRNGQYRYWFYSDTGTYSDLHSNKYPLAGTYTTNGPIIQLIHEDTSMQKVWVFRKLNGKTTLWRPNALQHWQTNRALDFYGILSPTDLKNMGRWRINLTK